MQNPTPLPPNGPVTARAFESLRPGTVWESSSRAAGTYLSQEYHNLGAEGLQLWIDVDVVGGGTVTVSVLARNPATGEFLAMTGVATTAIAAPGQASLQIYPGITELANAKVASLLPHSFKLQAVVATGPITFSVGGTLLP